MKLFQTNKEPQKDKGPLKKDINAEPAVVPQDEASEEQPQEEMQALTAADFMLSYEPDGVYLTAAPGEALSLQEQERLVWHFSRKKIKDLNMENMIHAIRGEGADHVLVAPPQEEVHYDEGYVVTISADMMEATITLSPPEPNFGKRLKEERLLEELAKTQQITFGVDRDALHALLEKPAYEEPRVIARGKPPVAGADGKLEWHIDRREESAVYRIREVGEDEKADYKNLDLFVHVKADQLLITRIPPAEGKPGRTVLGREVPAAPGKNYLLPQGKNTYVTKDGLELRASMPGRVDEINGRLEVSNIYHVMGDVDLSVGNIDFDGDVAIDGNVLNGFTIKATGTIEVKGIVEASAMEAGGDIFIRGGIQGGGRGVLQAKDGIYVRFAEYATIQAGSIVSAQSLLHSNVICFGSVEVIDGRGSIIGGNVCAGTYIAARYLGNPSGRTTELQVGLSPHNRAKIVEMEKMVQSLRKAVDRLQDILQDTPDAPAKSKQGQDKRMENVRKLLQCKKLMLDQEAELQELKNNLEGKKSGEVHALHTAYPGVCIAIGLARTMLDQPVTYATFRKGDGNIDFTNCRFKPRMGTMKKRRR